MLRQRVSMGLMLPWTLSCSAAGSGSLSGLIEQQMGALAAQLLQVAPICCSVSPLSEALPAAKQDEVEGSISPMLTRCPQHSLRPLQPAGELAAWAADGQRVSQRLACRQKRPQDKDGRRRNAPLL